MSFPDHQICPEALLLMNASTEDRKMAVLSKSFVKGRDQGANAAVIAKVDLLRACRAAQSTSDCSV